MKVHNLNSSYKKGVTRIDKNGEKNANNIPYILHFIDSTNSMASSLSNLANHLFEVIHRIKCKYRYEDKKCETCGTKYNYCDCIIQYTHFKKDLIKYKCLCCNKNYQQKFHEIPKERLHFNTYQFSSHDNNKLIDFIIVKMCSLLLI